MEHYSSFLTHKISKKLTKKPISTFLLVLFSSFLVAQKSTAIVVSLTKSNNNYQLHEIFEIPADPNEITVHPISDQFGLGIRHQKASGIVLEALITGAYQKTNSRKINVPYEEREDYSYEIDRGIVHLSLEAGRLWKVPKHPSLLFGLSGSAEPRITSNNYSSRHFKAFPSQFLTYELSVNLVPQFSYHINHKFLANIKVPIEVLSYNFIDGRIDNPNLPIEQQSVTKHLSYPLPFYPRLAVSVGYFFSHENRPTRAKIH